MLPSRKHKKVRLDQPIKGSGPGSILARLYRKILNELGISPERYEALFDRYVQKAALDPRRKSEVRAGLNEALLAEEMTMKTFSKGMDFLAVPEYDITITIRHASGRVTKHSLTIKQGELNTNSVEEDKDDDD